MMKVLGIIGRVLLAGLLIARELYYERNRVADKRNNLKQVVFLFGIRRLKIE